jgi:hypothetical protein
MGISTHTRRILWARSGGLCAKCARPIIEDRTDTDREALVGQECHIVSAATHGPRHEPPPHGGYDAIENLILLCSLCHDVVDAQPGSYPPDALRRLKAGHERKVSRRLQGGVVSQASLTPMPDRIELDLIASGRQLVGLLADTEMLVFDHDQPRSDAEADLIASLAQQLEDADLALHALGPAEAVRLGHDLQGFLTEDLLSAGLVVYGAVVHRRLTVVDQEAPWRCCVVNVRYAPPAVHGDAAPKPSELDSVDEQLLALLARGRRIRDSARIPDDGSSGVVDLWEQDVLSTLEEAGRLDLLTRFERRDAFDRVRGLLSARWRTRARLDWQLRRLSEFVGSQDGG